jgi:hypothetical protein
MEKKICVPEGMEQAALESISAHAAHPDAVYAILVAAVRWLSENPISPTDDFLGEMLNRDFFGGDNWTDPQVFRFCEEWQKRMFLDPVPPQEIADLLWDANPFKNTGAQFRHDEAVKEAYLRGQKAKDPQ